MKSTVVFGKQYASLKSSSDKHKRSVGNCYCENNKIVKHCQKANYNFSWDQEKVIDRESMLITRKIKEYIYSLRNSYHIDKISYMLPKI